MSRYNVYGEQVTSQDIQSYIGSTGAVAVSALQSVMVAGANCKKCDKQMTFIVRVMRWAFLIITFQNW